MNLYVYVRNGPVNARDAFGEASITVDDKVVAKADYYAEKIGMKNGFDNRWTDFHQMGQTWDVVNSLPDAVEAYDAATGECSVDLISKLDVTIYVRYLAADIWTWPVSKFDRINAETPDGGTTSLVWRGIVLEQPEVESNHRHELEHARAFRSFYEDTWGWFEAQLKNFNTANKKYRSGAACKAAFDLHKSAVQDEFDRILRRESRNLNRVQSRLDRTTLLFNDISGAGIMKYIGARSMRFSDPRFLYDPVSGHFEARNHGF